MHISIEENDENSEDIVEYSCTEYRNVNRTLNHRQGSREIFIIGIE